MAFLIPTWYKTRLVASISIPRCRIAYGADCGRHQLVVVRATRKANTTTLWQDTTTGDVTRLKTVTTEITTAVAGGHALLSAALPATESFARWLETPLTARDKALKVLPALLDVQLPFPLEICLHDFAFPQADAAGRFRAFAYAARRSDVEARLEQHHALGLDPVLLQHEGGVLWQQALTEIPLAPRALRIVAYVGDARTALAVGSGANGGELISLHGIRLGADELATPDAPAIRQWAGRVTQILRALPVTDAAEPIQWLWCGPGAELHAPLEPALAADERVRFKMLAEPVTFLARALAHAALRGDGTGNLRNGDLTHTAILAHGARTRRNAALNLLLAGLALTGLSLGWRAWLANRETRVQSAIVAAAQQLTGAAQIPYGQEVDQVQKALKKQATELQPFLDAFQPSAARDLAEVLAAARACRVTLDSLSHSGKALILHGATDDWNRCDPLAARLRAFGYAVELSREEAGADELVRFTLKGARR
ncbi:MAG: hypothetical protein EPN23_00390 [Verrucomicrobia bacterium]|nr:MAG: hypothetical protein EPN23_00390 [Verrucomicrobiota bacterium]